MTVVFRNEGGRNVFTFWKRKKPHLITTMRGVGPPESQNTKYRLANSIIWWDEINLRVVTLRQAKSRKPYIETKFCIFQAGM